MDNTTIGFMVFFGLAGLYLLKLAYNVLQKKMPLDEAKADAKKDVDEARKEVEDLIDSIPDDLKVTEHDESIEVKRVPGQDEDSGTGDKGDQPEGEEVKK